MTIDLDTLPERPDPEDLSALEILPLTPVSSSMRMKDEIKEGEEYNKELEVKKGTAVLSAMQAYYLNVSVIIRMYCYIDTYYIYLMCIVTMGTIGFETCQ